MRPEATRLYGPSFGTKFAMKSKVIANRSQIMSTNALFRESNYHKRENLSYKATMRA